MVAVTCGTLPSLYCRYIHLYFNIDTSKGRSRIFGRYTALWDRDGCSAMVSRSHPIGLHCVVLHGPSRLYHSEDDVESVSLTLSSRRMARILLQQLELRHSDTSVAHTWYAVSSLLKQTSWIHGMLSRRVEIALKNQVSMERGA